MSISDMEVIHTHCCGVDVHKKSVVACVITPKGKVIQTFGTLTRDLLELVDFVKRHQCTHVIHGEYRRVLEATVQPIGRRGYRSNGSQCTAY